MISSIIPESKPRSDSTPNSLNTDFSIQDD
jgi:hypothetical protein